MSRGDTGAISYDDAACTVLRTSQRQLRDAQWRAWLSASESCHGSAAARGIAHIRVSGEAKRRRGRLRWRLVAAAASGVIMMTALLG